MPGACRTAVRSRVGPRVAASKFFLNLGSCDASLLYFFVVPHLLGTYALTVPKCSVLMMKEKTVWYIQLNPARVTLATSALGCLSAVIFSSLPQES